MENLKHKIKTEIKTEDLVEANKLLKNGWILLNIIPPNQYELKHITYVLGKST